MSKELPLMLSMKSQSFLEGMTELSRWKELVIVCDLPKTLSKTPQNPPGIFTSFETPVCISRSQNDLLRIVFL